MNNLHYLYSIILSLLLSGLVGYERESQKKQGLRTTMLICLGATLIVIFSLKLIEISKGLGVSFDMIRGIAYYLVAIGFVGGNIVVKSNNKIKGITTSALLLPVSIVGFLCGIGDYFFASFVGVIIYLILKLRYIKIKIETVNKKRIRK